MSDRDVDILRAMSAAAPLLAAVHRTGSFSAAAGELGQTQSTVSHKIRALEDKLGYALFTRTTRHVAPTRRGQVICEAARVSVDAMVRAIDRIEKLNVARDTALTLSSSLAMKWLVPAMSRAADRGLRLSLHIDDAVSEIGADGQPQIAIRFGTGPYPGQHAELLGKCHAIAVAGNASRGFRMVTRNNPARLLRDLRAEVDGTAMRWESYLEAAGMHDLPTETGAEFERTDLAIQAAIAGLGHALGRSLLIEADISDGLLVVDGPAVPVPARYWLVTTHEHAQTRSYARVVDWLRSEFTRSQAVLAPFLMG